MRWISRRNCCLSFRIRTEFGVLTFLLPANIQRVYQVIVRDTRIPRSPADQRTGCPDVGGQNGQVAGVAPSKARFVTRIATSNYRGERR
jgi:hypothetical protein